MRLMVTRPSADAQATRQRLEGMGHIVLVEPMLRIEPGCGPLPQGPFDGVIVTGANAIAALHRLPGAGPLVGLPLLAVGERTAAAARVFGFGDVQSAGGDAAALAAYAAREWPQPRRVLHLAGADRSTDLAAALARVGHAVTTAVIYEAAKADRFSHDAAAALERREIDAVLHYSARTAEAFVACRRAAPGLDMEGLRHLCLSARVAGVLQDDGWRRILTAARPDEDALFALIAQAGR